VNLTRFRGVFIQGAVNLQGGTAFGTVTSAVNNTGATIQGGSSGVAGTLTINCSLTQGSGGTIQELISGRSAGQFSQILVNGVVGLGGALDVVVTSGFTLHSGEDFTILSASSLTGSFAMLDFNGSNVGSGYNDCLDYIGNNLGIEAVYNGANVTLDVVRDPQAVPEADPASAASGLTLLLGGLLILRGRRTIETRAI